MHVGVLSGDDKLEAALLARTRAGTEWSFYTGEELFLAGCFGGKHDWMIIQADGLGRENAAELMLTLHRDGKASRALLIADPGRDAEAYAALLRLCQQLGVAVIRQGPGLPTDMAADEAVHWLFGGTARAEGGRLIAFAGTTPNIGTTLVSFGTAVRLALDSEATVGYLCLNLKSSKLHRYCGKENAAATLDSIRAELKARRLHGERLLDLCEPVRGVPRLHVLYGNMLREQAEFFRPEEIECLLQAARSAFDLTIVEVNSYWDNAATVCAMLQADARIAVTTGELSHFQEDMQRWLHTVGPIFGIAPGSVELVVNQLDKRSLTNGIRAKEIRKETGMRLAAEIPRFPDITGHLNEGRILELFTGRHAFRQPAARIADRWIRQWNLPRPAGPGERSRIKRWLTGWRPERREVTGVESK